MSQLSTGAAVSIGPAASHFRRRKRAAQSRTRGRVVFAGLVACGLRVIEREDERMSDDTIRSSSEYEERERTSMIRRTGSVAGCYELSLGTCVTRDGRRARTCATGRELFFVPIDFAIDDLGERGSTDLARRIENTGVRALCASMTSVRSREVIRRDRGRDRAARRESGGRNSRV